MYFCRFLLYLSLYQTFSALFSVFIIMEDVIISEDICYPFPLGPSLTEPVPGGPPCRSDMASAPLISGLVMWLALVSGIWHIPHLSISFKSYCTNLSSLFLHYLETNMEIVLPTGSWDKAELQLNCKGWVINWEITVINHQGLGIICYCSKI